MMHNCKIYPILVCLASSIPNTGVVYLHSVAVCLAYVLVPDGVFKKISQGYMTSGDYGDPK